MVVNRSRFEVDLNRPPEEAVYLQPEDSWGMNLWTEPPGQPIIARSRQEHHHFYRRLGGVLSELADRHGGFVMYDVHSDNRRRAGPSGPPDDPAHNPVVNLGTGSLPQKWKPVAEASSLPFANSPSAGSRSTLVRMCDSRSLRRLVGLDVVGSKLMEVNVFSPGEIGSVSSLHEVDFAPLATL